MIKLIALLFFVHNLFDLGDCGTLPAVQLTEQTLIAGLLNGYNKNIRPDNLVRVVVSASIQQITSIDEKQQIMTSSLFITQLWSDDRLSWTPSNFSGIEVVMLPVKSIWIPDTMILNSADTSGYLTINDYSLASVQYDGLVAMFLPALTVKTRCSIRVKNFPFDHQICSINLTSWSQAINRILYIEDPDFVVDTSEYTEHPLWELENTSMNVLVTDDRAGFENSSNHVICVLLSLQRKPLYFMVNGVFACLILNCITVISYLVPYAAQVTLSMTCILTYSVNSLNFANLFPQQSEYLMMITLYLLLSISWTLISLVWFVLCNEYSAKGEMPEILDKFSKQLQKRIFCCCFPSTKADNYKKDAKNGVTPASVSPVSAAVCVHADGTNKIEQSKCQFCQKCQSCQENSDKDKAKATKKKEVEAKCKALNYFALLVIFLIIFISNMAIWISMSR